MPRTTAARVRVSGLQPVQVLAGLVGLVCLVAGILGFLRTGFGDYAGPPHASVLVFAVNPLHNTLFVVAGLLGLLMATSSGLARGYGWILVAGFGAALLWGLCLVGAFARNPLQGLGNPLALDIDDNWLHLGVVVAGLLIAVLPARKVVLVDEPARADTATAPIAKPTASDQAAGAPAHHRRPGILGRTWRRHGAT
jgi:hypothetical protein